MRLSKGERAYLRRRRAGLLQRDLAREQGVTRKAVMRWEADEIEPPRDLARALTRVAPLEELVIARRRSGLRADEIAEQLGRSRMAVWKMENGKLGPGPLRKFYERRGLLPQRVP